MNEKLSSIITWVIIPAMNEESVISEVVKGVLRYVNHVVVVDDGSNDDTALCSLLAGAHVIQHPINLGQGAALQTGILFAMSQGAQFLVTFDADGQHRPEDILQLASKLIDTGSDIALGSRFLGEAIDISFGRKLLIKVAIIYTKLTTGLMLTDAHNGLRMFTVKAAKEIKITQNKMAHASEIIESIARLKLKYVEVPVTIRYTEYSRKKGQKAHDAFKILVDLFTKRFFN